MQLAIRTRIPLPLRNVIKPNRFPDLYHRLVAFDPSERPRRISTMKNVAKA